MDKSQLSELSINEAFELCESIEYPNGTKIDYIIRGVTDNELYGLHFTFLQDNKRR